MDVSFCLLLIFQLSIVNHGVVGFVWRIVCHFIRFHSVIIIIVFLSVDFVGRLGSSAHSSIHPINHPLPAYYGTVPYSEEKEGEEG